MDTLFGSDLRPATRERCIEKALLDPDPRVVARGIAEAAQRKDAAAVRRLGQYLRGERRGAATPALEVQAVEALEGAEPTAARDVLAASLGRRRWSLRRAERRVCHRIVAALEGIGDEPSLAAISAWRRSPAARLGRLLRDGARS
jgi:hypothetical protein